MYYLIILVLLFLAELFYFHIADKYNIIDKPNERSSHTRITLRGGGIIFYLGALAYFLTSQFEYPWFMLALTLVTVISFVDDIRSISQGLRLVFHFTAMGLMFYQWELFTFPWWTVVVALIACTGIINAYNFMDGINGITGGYSLVVLGALAYVNAEVISFAEQNFIYTMICSVLVFDFFNFRKRAKCFAGDVGSVSIAFVVLFLIGSLILQTKDFSWLVFLVVYGGIIFYLGALAYFLTSQFEYPWFMLALTLVTVISFVDDIRSISQGLRLVFHFTAMGLMFYQWELFTFPWWTVVVALIACTGIINAYNFMDGINGITGGYSLVVLGALAYVNAEVISFAEQNFIYTMICSVLVFDFFNFRKRAKCFAGDVGSVSIAFVVLFLIGSLILQTKDFSWLVFLVVYGVDSVLTIVHRLLLHENIGLPHRKHLYQIMANELKIPHVVVSLTYMVVQGVVVAGYLALREYRYGYLSGSILVLGLLYLLFMKRFFYLHKSN